MRKPRTFLPSAGLNSDPDHVFTVENGVVHVSGTEFGYFITKHEYKNYYLRAEFKWGEGTFPPRLKLLGLVGLDFHTA